MKFGPVTIGGHMVTVIAIGFVLIGYMFWIAPSAAPAHVPTILAAVGAALAMLQKQAAVETKVIEVKADQAVTNHQVARSIHVSEANAHAIASVAVQQAQALEQVSQQLTENTVKTEGIHDIVNSRDVELRAELAALHKELAAIKQANAVKKVTAADGAA